MGPGIFILLLILIPGVISSSTAFRIIEFCPDTYVEDDPDEYIILDGAGPLEGVMITDGEGSFRFPVGAISGGRVTIALDGEAFRRIHGVFPDFEWTSSSPEVPDTLTSGMVKLANARDDLQLNEGEKIVQNISWPGDVHPREGQVHFLMGEAWDPRILLIGQSRFGHTHFSGVRGVAFVSPDNARQVFDDAVRSAGWEILVNVYEFTDPGLAEMLCRAQNRGVNVTVLLEAGPVGGISREELAVCYRMNQEGIGVFQMVSSDGIHAPYRFDHAKYLVIDRESVLITSENFKGSGFPVKGVTGNRGWGVWLKDPDLASFFAMVFHTDIAGPWIVPCLGSPGAVEWARSPDRNVEFEPFSFGPATVIPVISPDTSDEIFSLLENATKSIDIEQAYITNSSPDTINPYLQSAVDMSRKGVRVRVLLDSYWYNIEDEADNDEVVTYINQLAREGGLPLSAKCMDLGANTVEKIHNKGVIVDGNKVLISSINWNTNSPTFNREAGIIIEDTGVANYYTSVFEDDWNSWHGDDILKQNYLKVFLLGVIILVLIGMWWYRNRNKL